MIFHKRIASTIPNGKFFTPSPNSIRLLVTGDINFCTTRRDSGPIGVYRNIEQIKRPFSIIYTIIFLKLKKYWRQIYPEKRRSMLINKAALELTIKPIEVINNIAHKDHSSEPDFFYPFKKIHTLLKEKDFVLANLETPLADTKARLVGMLKSDPGYAQAMADAGISMVNLANNHIFDALDEGLSQTIYNLDNSNLSYTGFGKNRQAARRGKLVNIRGIDCTFLGYTQYCNNRFASIAADYPGILPLDPELVVEDIHSAKKISEYVFLSLHWGVEDQPYAHKRSVELGHLFIDAGADAIIGHHPHVPHGIEIYKNKPILYSLGNFIFGYCRKEWAKSQNFLAEIVFGAKSIQGIVIYPISGGYDVFQPYLLENEQANTFLKDLQLKSAAFGTGIAIENGIGYIAIG